ncbi:MAG: tetratricopeptide repeat protein [Anaerolineales bacterium]|nr:tetratricopeptide repeat protein [Anaerolineales bacterium]
MAESDSGFESLPPEYQQAIQEAEKQLRIRITPLQQLVGGWSGAAIYLVSVSTEDDDDVRHLVLKVDRKRPMSKTDEIVRHKQAVASSPPEFGANHIPEIVYDRVESEGAIIIFYAIAGQSLLNFRTLSQYQRQDQIEALFAATNHYLLDEWNAGRAFRHSPHPQELLQRWLGFRLDEGQNIEAFIRDDAGIHPEMPGFIVQSDIYPNPLFYARSQAPWGAVRAGDAVFGLQHSDLNTNNILAKFSRDETSLEGFFLIDFALFKENLPLLYDQRYLEMSYLVHAMSRSSFETAVDLIARLGSHDILEPHQAPIEMAGVNAAIRASRLAFERWVTARHASLGDDLWGQYWLAGTAAGLSYCHKAGQAPEIRLAGLIYASANLKQYFKLFNLGMPAKAARLALSRGSAVAQIPGAGSPRFSGKTPHNLPAPPTQFIGREAVLAEIMGLLRQPNIRLLTLTGPGGTGKTRLGLETGRTMQGDFPDGVYFIDLSATTNPELFATTAAHALGVREGGGYSPLETLKLFLADKKILLILDNLEQITAAAPDIGEILSAAPGVKAIGTSRIPLQLRGEQEYPVSPLNIPPEGSLSLQELKQYEAIELFEQQAQLVKPSFELTEENRAGVAEICRRLDGLPLAIEIAAARIKMLPPEAMLKRLDHSLKLLVSGAKDLPDRQQTLRRTIDWSYKLLDEDDRILFRRLNVFSGGFTLESAEAVCNPEGELEIFSGVETLLNSSLLRQVESVSEDPRFDMLQTIREFAQEEAEESENMSELLRAHCMYYAGLADGEMGQGLFFSDSVYYLKRFAEEHDNYRIALRTALGSEAIVSPAVAMLTPLTWYWYRYGHLREGREWMAKTLEVTKKMGDSPVRVLALSGATYLPLWSGDLNEAASLGEQAVQMAERLRFDDGLAMAKLGYGVALVNMGRDREAYPHLVDAVELFDEQQSALKGVTLVHLANVSLGLGDSQQALEWLDMALPLQEAVGDPWGLAFVHSNYGEVSRANGNYDKAEAHYRKTAEYYGIADAKGDQARLESVFGYLAMHKGDFAEARELFYQGLEDFRELGNQRGIAECLAGLAVIAAGDENIENAAWAATLLSAADRQLRAFGGEWWPADRVEIIRATGQLQSALGGQFESLWQAGQSIEVDEAIRFASTPA